MKSGQKNLLRVVLFGVLVLTVLLGLNSFMQPVWFNWNNYYTTEGFYEEPENTLETVFVGASIVTSGFTPTELYDQYGICAYNLGLEQQPMLATYYWTEEAYRLHPETLKTVVFDVSGLRSGSPNESFYHKSFDNMQFSEVKLRAIMDYKNVSFSDIKSLGDIVKLKNSLKDTFSFLIPFISYHDRWAELETTDFSKYGVDPINGTRGYYYLSRTFIQRTPDEVELLNTVLDEKAETTELDDYAMTYFYKLVDFCKEKDLQLLLIKTPTLRWSSSLHNTIVEYAEEYDLDFIDFNYSPYYEQLNYVQPYDSFDGKHLNYYGASKLTSAVGKYLVENCGATDVRNNERYAHMDEQLREYKSRIVNQVDLIASNDVSEYLETAVNDDTTVFISVKDDCSATLTDEQRDYFRSIGLEKLSGISSYDSYLAVIDKGEVVHEELNKKTDKAITFSGALTNGTEYSLTSGMASKENVSSCKIGGKDHSKNSRGINITVYSNGISEVVNSTAFDTTAANYRQAYSLELASELMKDKNNVEKYPEDTLYGKVIRFIVGADDYDKANELRLKLGENDVFGFLKAYSKKDKMIIISVRDDASKALTEKDRKAFAEMGLTKLSEIDYRDSYIGIIDGGEATTEIVDHGKEPIVFEQNGITVKSSGRESGNTSSIKFKNIEYSANIRGLNIAIYDKDDNRFVDAQNFDTSKIKIDS